jgi:hypothetical protein
MNGRFVPCTFLYDTPARTGPLVFSLPRIASIATLLLSSILVLDMVVCVLLRVMLSWIDCVGGCRIAV